MHQETEGLLSPFLREQRLRQVAQHIKPGSVVLDLACGNGFLSQHLPDDCKLYGVDRLSPTSLKCFTDFLQTDLLDDLAYSHVKDWLPEKPDYITSIAFLEHTSNPSHFVKTYASLLAHHGTFIGTTPHPRGRKIHDTLAALHLCSRSGAAEHETFLGHRQIADLSQAAGGTLDRYQTFLAGLNQFFVIRFNNAS